MPFCPACGTKLGDTQRFCPQCGRAVNAKAEKEHIYQEEKLRAEAQQRLKSEQQKKGCIGCLAAIAIVFVIGAIIIELVNKPSKAPPAKAPPTTASKVPADVVQAAKVVAASIQSNKLGVQARHLHGRRNPQGQGHLVYVPKTRFSGTERYVIWVVIDGRAFPLNSPSKMVTPSLPWPREAPSTVWDKTGFNVHNAATEAIDIVFRKRSVTKTPSATKQQKRVGQPKRGNFTVKEYRIYRAVIDTPMSITESEATSRAARRFDLTPAKAKEITQKVQRILAKNHWFGTPDTEIRHASDWSG